MLKAVSLSKHYDTELFFDGVDLILNAGDHVGLIGPNGAGKSTLLRLLVGEERPTTGSVTLAPGTTVGYFAQQVAHPDAPAAHPRLPGNGHCGRCRPAGGVRLGQAGRPVRPRRSGSDRTGWGAPAAVRAQRHRQDDAAPHDPVFADHVGVTRELSL